jgi:dTDP-4-amino-4,6-dideoxy-D-glucose/dTDP-4-amino-2,4-dideoxy-beta-L-xylose transaminase
MKKEIPLFKVYMAETAASSVEKVLNSGFIGQGPVVDEFESELSKYFQHPYISTLNSATSAEHLALHLLKKPLNYTKADGYGVRENTWAGLQDGDEVLSTALTCTATNWPILANNLKIKWVDIDPKTLNMDLDDLERKISPSTKAIMVVHWGGYPIDLERIRQIQEKSLRLYGFKPAVIEDCAHAMGSKYKGQLIGTHGNICTFSLQAIKHVTSVDGGLLFLPHEELNRRARLLRWYGIDRDSPRKDFRCEANIEEWGFKFHMNDVNAAIGLENFKHMDHIISKHKSNAKYYDENLKNIPDLTLLERHPDMESSFWIYSLLVERRSDFMKHMKECGISVSQVHERNDIHNCVKDHRSMLPNLDKTIGKVIAIPVGWWVTEEDRKYIVDCIKKGW